MGARELLVYLVGLDSASADPTLEALAAEGYTWVRLEGPRDAEVALRSLRPDAMIVDVPSDARAALGWIARCRDCEPELGRRVLALVPGDLSSADREALGRTLTVAKPFERAALLQPLRAILHSE